MPHRSSATNIVGPCSLKPVVLDWLDSPIPLQSEEQRALSRTFAARKIFVSILEPWAIFPSDKHITWVSVTFQDLEMPHGCSATNIVKTPRAIFTLY